MAKKKRPAKPPASRLAPELDDDLAELYFNHSATIEQRGLLVQLQQVRILRELQAGQRAARLNLRLESATKKPAKSA